MIIVSDGLTNAQRKKVGLAISKEFRLKRQALRKRAMGKKLSEIERRRIKRGQKQIIRIGFEKAREEDPEIPKLIMRESK